MSNVMQRLAQRGAAPAAATGLAPLQMRPRSRFDTATPGVETADATAATGFSTPASTNSPTPLTRSEARPAFTPRAAAPETRATRTTTLRDRSAEPSVSIEAEAPAAPPQASLPDARGEPPPSPPTGKAEPSRPAATVEHAERPDPAFAAREPAPPEPARPRAETAERSAPVAFPFGSHAEQAEPAAAEAPPSLSIGRLEVQFVQPPAPPAPAARVRRGASGFADYARIRRGSPR